MRRWVEAVVFAASLSACRTNDAPPRASRPAVDAASEAKDAVLVASDDEDAGRTALAWPDALRVGRFAEAADAIARLSAEEQRTPEIRLAKARVFAETKRAAAALEALEGLDDELPLVRDLVTKMRALAMFEVGPYDKAAEYFTSRRDVASWVRAAQAWDKAGDGSKSKAAWQRVITAARRTRAQEERARFRRMSMTRLERGDAAAVADARWLTIHALAPSVFSESAKLLEKLSPPNLLTAAELLERARVLADAGRTDEALRAVARAPARGKVPALDLCRARAEILWRARTRYREAAVAYRKCAKLGGPREIEHLFLAARALSRANHDAEAIAAWKDIVKRHPRTKWAEQAEFHVARTHALLGHWKDSALAFDAYVRRWPKGKERREAARYRALAHLVSRHDAKARKLLEDLAGSASDPITSARWTNLAALAALRDGDKLHALARWAEVARSRPLSYPALVARARIKENGGTPPPAIEPSEAGERDPIVVELPPPVDMLHRIGFDAEAEAELIEREATVIAKAPTRGIDALCAAYARIDRAKRRYRVAMKVPAQKLATAPGPQNRLAWECVFPTPHASLVHSATQATRVAPELVWSIMRQESAFHPEAISPAGAVGLMQLMPATARVTAKAAGIEHDDAWLRRPAHNIALGALYLREVLDVFDGNAPLAIGAYNAGPEAIRRWMSRTKDVGLDVFIEAIPFLETRGYVVKVLGNLARYGYLEGGEAGVPELRLDLN